MEELLNYIPMNLNFGIISYIDFLLLVQGVSLSLMLLLNYEKQKAYLILGLLGFVLLGELLDFNLLIKEFESWPISLFPFKFIFLFAPLFYFFSLGLTHSNPSKRILVHLGIGLIPLTIWLILLFTNHLMNESFLTAQVMQVLQNTSVLLGILVSYAYLIAIIIYIYQYSNEDKKKEAKENKFYCWTTGTVVYLLLLNTSLFFTLILPFNWLELALIPIIKTINTTFLFWICLSGFQQRLSGISIDTLFTWSSSVNIQRARIPFRENSKKIGSLLQRIEAEKIYTNPELSLNILAKEVKLSERELSRLINLETGMNFNQFINEFRVKEAKQLLLNQEYDHWSMAGIASEVGFNSKTSFYNTFKKNVGTTPYQYKKNNLNGDHLVHGKV